MIAAARPAANQPAPARMRPCPPPAPSTCVRPPADRRPSARWAASSGQPVAQRPNPAADHGRGGAGQSRAPPRRRPDADQPRRRGLRPGPVQRPDRGRPRPATRADLLAAAGEETDATSRLVRGPPARTRQPAGPAQPLWYAGSFAIGALAGLRGDGWNLGFVVETERARSRPSANTSNPCPTPTCAAAPSAGDEGRRGRHADHAEARRGEGRLPPPIPALMAAASKLMKTVAYGSGPAISTGKPACARHPRALIRLRHLLPAGGKNPRRDQSQVAAVVQLLDLALQPRLDLHPVA